MAKVIFFEEDARQRVLKGAEIVYNAVKTTMGPKGRNVVIGKNYGIVVTHDGVTVAKAVELPETEKTMGYKTGAELVKSAALKMNDLVGDGTTTITVLAYHILSEANKLIAAGHNPMELRKGLEAAKDAVLAGLGVISEDISKDFDKLAQIATISAGDKEIGKLIADVMKKVGKDGVVTVEESQGVTLESEVVKGYTFDKGYISPYMISDQARGEAILEKPFILITDAKIRSVHDFLPLVEEMAKMGKKELLIIAEDVEGEALQTLVLNKLKGTFNTVCVKAPSFGDFRKETLNDLAILTGATFVSEDQGMTLPITDVNVLGQARRVIIGRNETTIIEGAGAVEDIDLRVKQIEEQSKHADSKYNESRYTQRAAALGGKVAVIRVGGVTETEIEEKKFRVDDAVHAAKAALAEGILPGGGVTMLYLADLLTNIDSGTALLINALQKPFEILLTNSGLKPDAYYEKLKDGKLGVNVNTGQVVDLKEAGIIDPTKVTKEAIMNAVSIAGTAITMGALIVEEPQKESAMPMPPMAGAM